jgi:GntR family transcriptional regulator
LQGNGRGQAGEIEDEHDAAEYVNEIMSRSMQPQNLAMNTPPRGESIIRLPRLTLNYCTDIIIQTATGDASKMKLSLDSESGVPIYLQVMRQIRLLIAGGTLRPGDQLPSVRELAVKLRINPNTVAKAYRELQHEKIIGGKWGEGNYVSDEIPELAQREKEQIILDEIKQVATRAHSLGYTPEELRNLFLKTFK